MKRLIAILALVMLTPILNTAQHPKYPYNHVFHASVNTVTVYAEAYNGSSTAAQVNNALSAYPAPARIVITPGMSGTNCDFTGITLSSSQYSLVDLREGKISWGFKDPSSTGIVCEVQSGTGGTTINTLTVNNFNNASGGTSGLIAGGAIYYTGTGYQYTVTRAEYSIGGVVYNSPQTNITLAASDPTNPRIDTVYVDNTGSVGVLTGTPAAAPSQPSVDPTTQIQLGFITVPAASTAPTGTSTENIYLEDAGPPAEWGCATSGTGWNCADTTHPYAGTKDIQSLGTDAASYVHLTRSAVEDTSTNNVLFLQLRSESAWHGKFEIWATFYNGTTPVGNTVFAQNNSFGWDGKTTGAYQLVGIPLSAFNLSTASVDGLRIKWNNGGTTATNSTIYLDNIQLQQNGVQGGGSGGGGSSSGLTQVNGNADGNFFPATIPISISAGVETMDFTPNDAPVNTVWAGPLGSGNSNVGVNNVTTCPFQQAGRVATYTCAQTSESFAVGDKILIMWGRQFSTSSTTFTDTLGTSFTTSSYASGSGTAQLYAIGTVATAGKDTITAHSIDEYFEFASVDYFFFQIIHLTGANAVVGSSSTRDSSGNDITRAVSPANSTDALIRLGFLASNNAATNGSIVITPLGTTTSTFGTATVVDGYGGSDIYAPGSTASVSNLFDFTTTTGGSGPVSYGLVIDVSQSAGAGSGPGSYKSLSTLLQGAAPRAVQSVATFTINAAVNLPSATNTTVLTGAVTMPSSGCPCRALVQSGIFLNSTTSAQWGWWASDGTNTFGYGASITTDAHTPPVQIGTISPVSYAVNQAVTFSIVINPGTYGAGTVQALSTLSPPLPAAAKSWMTVTIIPSSN